MSTVCASHDIQDVTGVRKVTSCVSSRGDHTQDTSSAASRAHNKHCHDTRDTLCVCSCHLTTHLTLVFPSTTQAGRLDSSARMCNLAFPEKDQAVPVPSKVFEPTHVSSLPKRPVFPTRTMFILGWSGWHTERNIFGIALVRIRTESKKVQSRHFLLELSRQEADHYLKKSSCTSTCLVKENDIKKESCSG